LTFLWTEVGSMSMWTIRAREANAESFPVTRSSKRAPMATIRSPCMPNMPRLRGWAEGKEPRPMRVVVTWMRAFSASWKSSSDAPEEMTPPPA